MHNTKCEIPRKKLTTVKPSLSERKFINEMYLQSSEPDYLFSDQYKEYQSEKNSWNN